MKRVFVALAAVAVFGGMALTAPARAVPPTVTPSPGYDARLQEQRSATTIYTPAPARRPTSAKRFRRGQ
ncbi:MAG TPA: hypothetical protein VGD13_16340 [Xanthobacteraceae bacterium]|jgi:hypothetical protein